MVLGNIFRKVAKASAQHIVREATGRKEDLISFLSLHEVPELHTLTAAPDQVASEKLRVVYEHHTHKLMVQFSSQDKYTFLFREDHVVVLSKVPFDYDKFKEKLRVALSFR